MDIIGGILVVLIVFLLFYIPYKFTVAAINMRIEEAVDKNARPEVQEEQREKAEMAILEAMRRVNPFSSNNFF